MISTEVTLVTRRPSRTGQEDEQVDDPYVNVSSAYNGLQALSNDVADLHAQAEVCLVRRQVDERVQPWVELLDPQTRRMFAYCQYTFVLSR
jgi:hypothetical protein